MIQYSLQAFSWQCKSFKLFYHLAKSHFWVNSQKITQHHKKLDCSNTHLIFQLMDLAKQPIVLDLQLPPGLVHLTIPPNDDIFYINYHQGWSTWPHHPITYIHNFQHFGIQCIPPLIPPTTVSTAAHNHIAFDISISLFKTQHQHE